MKEQSLFSRKKIIYLKMMRQQSLKDTTNKLRLIFGIIKMKRRQNR